MEPGYEALRAGMAGAGRKKSERGCPVDIYTACTHPGKRVIVWKGREAQKELLGESDSREKGNPILRRNLTG